MKKEFIAATDEHSHEHEIAFVEDFWTKKWEERGLPEFATSQVEDRDEFKITNRYLERLPKGSKILDGGSGLGEWVLYYALKGYEMVGLDISKKTIDLLQQKFPKQQFVLGDIRHTGFADNSFDAYLSWGTFEHFEEGLDQCFREASRIVKPGGYLIITVPFYNGFHRYRDQRDEIVRQGLEHGVSGPVRFYQWRLTKEDVKEKFEANGFRVLEFEPLHRATGLRRAIKYYIGGNHSSPVNLALKVLLYPFLPKDFIGHMLLAVGQKKSPG